MKNKKTWKRWLAVGLTVVAIAAITVGAVSAHGIGGWFGRGSNEGDTYLADELGITVDELDSAREAARDKALDQALADGTITQEQYDNMQGQKVLQAYLDPRALTANALGISVDDLESKTVSEWLEELDIDRDEFRTLMDEARETAITQAIADGVVTQEQVDALPGTGMRGAPGMRGRPGMRGGRDKMGGCPDCAPEGDGLQDSGFRPSRGNQGSNL